MIMVPTLITFWLDNSIYQSIQNNKEYNSTSYQGFGQLYSCDSKDNKDKYKDNKDKVAYMILVHVCMYVYACYIKKFISFILITLIHTPCSHQLV